MNLNHLLYRHFTCPPCINECVVQVKNNCLHTFSVHFQRTQTSDRVSRFGDVTKLVNCMLVVVVVANDR